MKDLFRGKRNLTSTPNIEKMGLIAFQTGSDTNMQFGGACAGGPPSFSRQSGTLIITVTTLFSS